MEFFQQLGELVEQRWKARNYDEARFAEVALSALQELSPASHVDYLDLVHWALNAPRLPPQNLVSDFGQPPLTVYHSQWLYIEALFWLDATTDIHQHGFSGAFHVLAGSSLASRYEFEVKERINARLHLGNLRFKCAEYLRTGDSRPILPGARLIHSVFHLDHPSVTLVVRTQANLEAGPQFSYLRPGVAFVRDYENELLTRQLELLNVLRSCEHPDYLKLLSKLLAAADSETVFRILEDVGTQLQRKELLQLVKGVESQHGAMLQALWRVLEEKRWRSSLMDRRQAITDPDHRFFFALLLNLPNRRSVFEFIQQRYSTDPVEQIMQWVEELSGSNADAGTGALGFRFDEESLGIFRGLLEGLAFPVILERLKQQHDTAQIMAHEKHLHTLYSALRKSSLPLFIN